MFDIINNINVLKEELDALLEKDAPYEQIYILSDIGNYDVTYKMHGRTHYMSPDEHMSDVKRVIAATSDHAKRVSVVMPLLYESRQHKRKGRESLDCAYALQELIPLGVQEIVTFDVHDPNVSNAVPLLAFENIYPTNIILEDFVKNNPTTKENLLIVAPDFGAMERARYFAEMLKCDVGVFYKRRDLSKVVFDINLFVIIIFVLQRVFLYKHTNNNNQNQEKIIKLNQHDPDYIPISISFNMNEIIIGNEESEQSINFFTDLIEESKLVSYVI